MDSSLKVTYCALYPILMFYCLSLLRPTFVKAVIGQHWCLGSVDLQLYGTLETEIQNNRKALNVPGLCASLCSYNPVSKNL